MASFPSSLLECSPPAASIKAPPPSSQHCRTNPSRPSTEDGPFADFGVKIVDGVVWFWLLEQWQDLPNELWAWKYGPYGCGDWVPSLLLFDFWEYRHDRILPSYSRILTSVVDRPPVPSVIAIIAPWLFEILRSSGDSRLGRTCRLVCRDWANKCSIRHHDRVDRNWRVEDGKAWYQLGTEWRHLPNRLWAWSIQDRSDVWWVERRWFPKLVQPIDDSIQSIQEEPRYPSTSSLSLLPPGRTRLSVHALAAALPPELFKYICDAADNDSSSSRLVCRYWNRLCSPRVFERIDVKQSPERIRALWKHRTDPLIQHLTVVENVPAYSEHSLFPWVHLLSHSCTSTQSVWKTGKDLGCIIVDGPFTGGHQTIRSVHFALPRSLPRSLSRGIKELDLFGMHFHRFEDLIHVLCELADLEEFNCDELRFDSFPIEPPRRRPRTNRNKLRKVQIFDDDSIPPSLVLSLYLSVYDVMSFLSESEIVVALALLQVSHRFISTLFVHYDDNPLSRRLDFTEDCIFKRCQCTILSLQILRGPTRSQTTFRVIVDSRGTTRDEDFDHWTRLDTTFSQIDPHTQTECVFGFADREEMVHFAATILKKMPSISAVGNVRYSIHTNLVIPSDEEGEQDDPGQWYRASLDSEELTGTGVTDLAEVYSWNMLV